MSQAIINAIRVQQELLQAKILEIGDRIDESNQGSITAREELEQLVRDREAEISELYPIEQLLDEQGILRQAWHHLEDSINTLLQDS